MKVLVCGGRDYSDKRRVREALEALYCGSGGPVSELIEGGASGADRLAHWWAVHRGVLVTTFPADWKAHGRAAGPIRNQQMLDEGRPDLVVAFPGGRGTADMVRRAKAAGVRVIEIAA